MDRDRPKYEGMTEEQTRRDQKMALAYIREIEELSKARELLLRAGASDYAHTIGLLDDERKQRLADLRDTESFKVIQGFVHDLGMTLVEFAQTLGQFVAREADRAVGLSGDGNG